MSKIETKPLSIRIDEETHAFLENYSRKVAYQRHQNITKSDVIREMVDDQIEQLKESHPDCVPNEDEWTNNEENTDNN